MFQSEFAQRLTELEGAWLRPRMLKLGQAPNLLLTSLVDERCADVNLYLSANRQWRGALHAGLSDLPFADQSFGTVVLQHVLEWSGEERALLRECLRVLEPGGRLLLVGFNPYAWSRWYRLRKGFAQRARLRGYGHWRRVLTGMGMEFAAAHYLAWPESRLEAQLPRAMHAVYLLSANRSSEHARWTGRVERLDVPMAYTGWMARDRQGDGAKAKRTLVEDVAVEES